MPDEAWNIQIATPDGEVLRPAATLLELNTVDGQIGVMAGHARLVTMLTAGELVVTNGSRRDVFLVGGGFARISPSGVSVMAFSLERQTDDAALARCQARAHEFQDGNGSAQSHE